MAEYFSHDYDAREDEKIQNLLFKYKMEGYGIYWSIVEMLYKNDGYMQLNCERIAYVLQADGEIISGIINDFDLFVVNDDRFTSDSVLKRLEIRNEKSQKARESALKRWNDANAMQTQSKGNAIKEKKGKEIKEDEDAATSIWKLFWNKEVKPIYGEHLIRRHNKSKIFVAPFTPTNITSKQRDAWVKEWQKKLEPINKRLKEINQQ